MTYKAIFVDWNGTLSHSRFWERWAHDEKKRDDYKRIQHVLFEHPEGKLFIKEWMLGSKVTAHVLQYLHSKTNIPLAELESELRYSAENMDFSDPMVIDKVQILRNLGVKVVIATDNMDTFRLWTVAPFI